MRSIPYEIKSYFNENLQNFNYKSTPIPDLNLKHEIVNWVINQSKWPFLPIELPNFPYKEAYNEALQLEEFFSEHRMNTEIPEEYRNRDWSSVCLHGEDWNKTESFTAYEENKGKTEKDIKYKWCTEITTKCPVTTKYFQETFPAQEYQRVRFMKLEPQGYILPHKDRENNMLMPINIALNNPDGCLFRMKGKGDVPFNKTGSASLVDISNEHSVWNNSSEARIHMIVHFIQNEEFDDLVYSSFKRVI